MPEQMVSEVYFIGAMMFLILVVCFAAVFFFFRQYRREMREKAARSVENKLRAINPDQRSDLDTRDPANN